MPPELSQDVVACILDVLDAQYTEDIEDVDRIWHPGRILTLSNLTLTSRLFRQLAQLRLLAHISFTIGHGVQERAAQLLSLLQENGTDILESGPQLKRMRSLRLKWSRDEHSLSDIQAIYDPSSSTPAARLLQLFLRTPQLRVLKLDGQPRSKAQCREYIFSMSSKPSLHVLALSDVSRVPIEIILPSGDGHRGRSSMQCMDLFSINLRDNSSRDQATTPKSSTLKHLKVDDSGFPHPLQILRQQQALRPDHSNTARRRAMSLISMFPKLRTLSVIYTRDRGLPGFLVKMWELACGFTSTLEHLQIRNFEPSIGASQFVLRGLFTEDTLDKFINLTTLSLTTVIESGASWSEWTNESGALYSGLHYLAILLTSVTPRSVPKLKQLHLEFFLTGKEISKQYTDTLSADLSLATAARNPVWKTFDAALASALFGNPAHVTITLRPFFCNVEQEKRVFMEDTRYYNTISNSNQATINSYGMDVCLPILFGSAVKVDIQVIPSFSDRDMLHYVKCSRS